MKIIRNVFAFVVVITLAVSLWIGIQSWGFYRFLKQMPALYSLGLFENDPILGYRLRKEMKGWYVLPSLDSIPVFTCREGHRSSMPPIYSDSLFFLGDSFTFGEACPADSTFAFLSSEAIKRYAVNFGTGGYGLAQMWHIYANSKPGKTWIIQWSPWLAERAVRGRLDSKMVIVPSPMLMPVGDSFSFQPPAYHSALFPLSGSGALEPYRPAASRPKSFLSFLSGPGCKIYGTQLLGECSKLFNKTPNIEDAETIHDAFLKQLNQMAISRKDTVLILLIGYDYKESLKAEKKLSAICSLPVLNASAWLYQQTKGSDQDYEAAYMHWDSAHTTILDRHPNARAHRLISDTLVKSLTQILAE